ncbi:COMM domain-containing protein 4 isoform X2 [Macrosteles quadrilineatus]|uniref:COMM domain-containing protein 4 isoform X2 n=1 Tax=Macrosteles quadrilineatus TaxID=74068 RepID=UPI0023E30210|nr:COMM domain-containing protein 4 isoform X2 [Macrosteles quadrilineatus]
MRFRFCGDGDCPDWILVQINTLARMSSIKMKLLCQVVADSLVEETPLNYEKVKKLTSDAKFDEDEVKATVSALTYILTSAAKYGVPENTLTRELQQIGFPREHGQALCRVYSEREAALTSRLVRQSLRTSRLVDVATQRHGAHCTVTLTYFNSQTDLTHKQTFTASDSQITTLLCGIIYLVQ